MSHGLTEISSSKSFSGWLKRYRHYSPSLGCEMIFAIYLPPQIEQGQIEQIQSEQVKSEQVKVPLLWWLSGLTCNDENFMQKAGAQRVAAELGIAIVCPDTSPRGLNLPGESDSYDLGTGAGFYVNATQQPWQKNYRMYDYIANELPALIAANFPVNGREAISGHSMGGHGALVLGLRQPQRYASISAFAPIANPSNSPWGEKALSHYLGSNRETWAEYDACRLVESGVSKQELMVDQGAADNFLQEQLKPELLQAACASAGHPLRYRLLPGYDHSYFFIATFIEDHLRYHAKHLYG